LPLFNTLLVLASCTTIVWTRYAIMAKDARGAARALALTIFLGASFLALRAYEFANAPFPLGLDAAPVLAAGETGDVNRLLAGEAGQHGAIYGSAFVMLTGLHAVHVAVGVVFFIACWLRVASGRMTAKSHFGLEAAAWYWYFGVVLWLLLFVSVYVLSGGNFVAVAILR
jgi:cytochrome c oxidase subunit 3